METSTLAIIFILIKLAPVNFKRKIVLICYLKKNYLSIKSVKFSEKVSVKNHRRRHNKTSPSPAISLHCCDTKTHTLIDNDFVS